MESTDLSTGILLAHLIRNNPEEVLSADKKFPQYQEFMKMHKIDPVLLVSSVRRLINTYFYWDLPLTGPSDSISPAFKQRGLMNYRQNPLIVHERSGGKINNRSMIRKHPNGMFSCKDCDGGEMFETYRHASRHVSNTHRGPDRRCEHCQFTTTHIHSWEEHQFQMHNIVVSFHLKD